MVVKTASLELREALELTIRRVAESEAVAA